MNVCVTMLYSICGHLANIHLVSVVVLDMLCGYRIQAKVWMLFLEIGNHPRFNRDFITGIGRRTHFKLHNFQPVKQEIGEVWGGAHQARIYVMCRIVRPPADRHSVVQRCADSAVDGQQGFVAGAVLQAFGLEVCNQLLIGDFRDLCVVCRKVRRDVRFYIVGKVGILLCGNICNLVIEPLTEEIGEQHSFVGSEIVRVKLGTGFHEHFLCPLLVSLNGESCADGLASPLSSGIFPCQNHLEIAVLLS